MIHVSSTEPPALRKLGKSDTLPEKYGVDVLWYSEQLKGMVGVQRKEFKDLLASLEDGRLSFELKQMGQLALSVVAIEGDGIFTDDGQLVRSFGRPFTRSQLHSIILGISFGGVRVVRTASLDDTIRFCEVLVDWAEKEEHGSLFNRPGPVGEWGKPTNREFQRHLLMGMPGIGRELADRILEHFNGIPWGWTCDKSELLAIPGLGKKKVERIWEALEWKIEPDS